MVLGIKLEFVLFGFDEILCYYYKFGIFLGIGVGKGYKVYIK